MNPIVKVAILTITALALSGCGWFGGKDDEEKALEPLELVDINTTLSVKKLWSAKVGKDAEFLRVRLQPA